MIGDLPVLRIPPVPGPPDPRAPADPARPEADPPAEPDNPNRPEPARAARTGRAAPAVNRDQSRAMVRSRVADPREHVSLGHRTAPHRGRVHAASQTWTGLLFAHYRADPAALALLLPPQATLDLYDGDAWLTVSPFRATLRPLPDLPLPAPTLSFLNVRTYV